MPCAYFEYCDSQQPRKTPPQSKHPAPRGALFAALKTVAAALSARVAALRLPV